jgi:SpoVK/Ycf46/Vps4 family AAA+-type ATPase
VNDGKVDGADLPVILSEKMQVIKKTGILEFINTDIKISDIGGLENLKNWLKKRNNSWSESAKKYCLPAPKGVLITGVPGCGKSLTAKAMSAAWQLPLLKLDFGKIFSGIVGSSEENMRKAIKTAEAVAPSILWVDEIEKSLSGLNSNGDSGTSSRIFGTFLTWMQEKTAPVFVIATANNISSLPAELLRKGRFDEIFFVDLPTFSERKEIFKLHLSKRLKDKEVSSKIEANDQMYEKLASMTEGFVGAEIEQVVITALYEAFFNKRPLEFEDLENTIKNIVPLSVTQKEQILSLRQWANVRAVAATKKDDMAQYSSDTDDNADVNASRGGRALDV